MNLEEVDLEESLLKEEEQEEKVVKIDSDLKEDSSSI